MADDDNAAAAAVRAVTVDGVPVLRIAGEIDVNAVDAVRPELLAWLDRAPEQVVVDLTGVTFIGSSGLALLVEAAGHADRGGVRFVLVADHRAVLRPFEATNLGQVFDLYPDVDRAVAATRFGAHPSEADPQDA
ncbi:anti-anti-sigma factor [Saccharothrix saharensis]|uniref:Anti-sigma factor antagonist n=1 Tax=Saccharothrix saharensis TaxID=571190 RepID=A0A543J7K7_9PSEU|nr:anti-sigma factor antagonist [Saccharothrix saharensis]TQM78778.1 anti-anti-sigma factor [Saccharothrix saharensis]